MSIDSPAQSRHVLVHHHIFKNAGSSLDSAIRGWLGDAWAALEQQPPNSVSAAELVDFIVRHPNLRGVSSHSARWPTSVPPDIAIHEVVLLRHPIDRLGSIYEQYRRLGTSLEPLQPPAREISYRAAATGFSGFIEWLLDTPTIFDGSGWTLGIASSFQTLMLSDRAQLAQPPGGRTPIGEDDLRIAKERLIQLRAFGIVDEYDASLTVLYRSLEPFFPDIRLPVARENGGNRNEAMQTRLGQVERGLGPKIYARAVEANAADLALYDFAKQLFAERKAQALTPGL